MSLGLLKLINFRQMTIYIFLAILAILFLWLGKNPVIYWTFFFILVVFAGGRGFATGGDTWFYYWGFQDMSKGEWITSLIKFPEYLYAILNKIVYLLGGNYRVFLFIDAIVSLFPIFYVARKYALRPHYVVSFFILLYFYCCFLCFTRQYCAIGYLLIAYVKLAKKDDVKAFLMFVCIATLFHGSSLAAVIVLFFRKRKYYPLWGSVLLIGSYVIGRSGIMGEVMSYLVSLTRFGGYLTLKNDSSFTLNGLLVVIFFSWLLYLNKEKRLFCYIIVLGITLQNILSFEMDLARISWSFTIVEAFLLGDIKYKKLKVNLVPIFVVYSSLVFINMLSTNQAKVMPYDFTLSATPPRGFSYDWIGNKNK